MNISKRALNTFSPIYYMADHVTALGDLLSIQNPNGYMDFTVAENTLCWDILQERMKISQTFPEGMNNYTISRGFPMFLDAMSDFISTYYSHHPVSADEISLMSGSASVINTLLFTVLEEGECVMLPTPNYACLPNDFKFRNGVHIFNVDTIPFDYRLPLDLLESSYQQATDAGEKVKCLFLVNPLNPIGITYSKEELEVIIHFCKEKKLHLISDEDYGNATFGLLSEDFQNVFHSVSEVVGKAGMDDFVHIIGSFSKDFGISGFRVGYLYSCNKDVIATCDNLGSFQNVSNYTQVLLTNIITDKDFLSYFLKESQLALRKSRGILEKGLTEMGVPFVPGDSTFFIWIDLRKYLKDSTFQSEKELYNHFLKNKIVLGPGECFLAATPGYFRLVYSYASPEILQIGIERFKRVLHELS